MEPNKYALAFISEETSYVGSNFGHVFLVKLDKRNVLLSKVYSYSANTDGISSYEVILKGLFSSLPGHIEERYLYEVINHYLQEEKRDVWIFFLKNHNEVISKDLKKIDNYNFFIFNCSTYISQKLRLTHIYPMSPIHLISKIGASNIEKIVKIDLNGEFKTVNSIRPNFLYHSKIALGLQDLEDKKYFTNITPYYRNLTSQNSLFRFSLLDTTLVVNEKGKFDNLDLNALEQYILIDNNISRKIKLGYSRTKRKQNFYNVQFLYGGSKNIKGNRISILAGAEINNNYKKKNYLSPPIEIILSRDVKFFKLFANLKYDFKNDLRAEIELDSESFHNKKLSVSILRDFHINNNILKTSFSFLF